jgi:tRNA threonylcarbamoyladenosine biosynthesis protein TsaB
MAKILAFDTSLDTCSVALAVDDKDMVYLEERGHNIHSARLNILIEEVMKKGEISLQDLDAICVNRGPGSYTGLRIGISTAKGLGYALDTPIIGANTLQAMTMQAMTLNLINSMQLNQKFNQNALYCPMIDARRMEIYYALLDMESQFVTETKAEVVEDDFLENMLHDKEIYFFGNGLEKCRHILEKHKNALFIEEEIYPTADWMATFAKQKYQAGEFEDAFTLEPFYLKDFVSNS